MTKGKRQTIGERIREARKRKRLTQAEVGGAVGVTQGTVAGWERSDNDPLRPKIEALASLLDVSREWLEWGDEASPNSATNAEEEVVYPEGRPTRAPTQAEPRLRIVMRQMKLNDRAVARRANLPLPRVRALMRGSPEQRDELERIAAALDINIGELLDFTARDEHEAMMLHQFRRAAEEKRGQAGKSGRDRDD